MKRNKLKKNYSLGLCPSDKSAYSSNCTFFKLICLIAKALRRMTMLGFLIGATELEKSTLRRVQLRFSGLCVE